MSERFTRINSNYVMRNRHQKTDLGTIMERDWTTTNGLNVLRFGTGRKWYTSGNFIFTISNIPSYHKKHKLTLDTKSWTWDECKDADGTVNEVKPNFNTNDLRSYAYYGSCSELIRATIEEIILDFPGIIKVTSRKINDEYYIDDDYEGYIVENQFGIDLYHNKVELDKYDNELRFIGNSWDKYCIRKDDEYDNVIDFVSTTNINPCLEENEGKKVTDITFYTESHKQVKLRGYFVNGDIMFACEDEGLIIQPQKKYIDEYFGSLKGFKAQLLRRDTNPLYKNAFITPEEFEFRWYYPERNYVWPSDETSGYCINISGNLFDDFINSLMDVGEKLDELWCDNIYRSMTHESIKNFDWTYSRHYYEGEEQDNIDGGERMQKILRVFGRVFDDVKYYIDNIKLIPNITYDKVDNCPEALMSDSVALCGIETISTIDSNTEDGEGYNIKQNLTEEFLGTIEKDTSWLSNSDNERVPVHSKWFGSKRIEDVYPTICDNEIMRRLVLSAKRLMMTKGTQNSIDMIMGMFGFGRNYKEIYEDGQFSGYEIDEDNSDYLIEEEAYYTEKMIPYNECVNDERDDWTSKTDLPVDWNGITSNTKGDVAVEVNNNKDLERLYYEDPFSGVPLATIFLGPQNEPYLVPYYNQSAMYDGDLIFQNKGGWGKMIKNNDDDTTDDCFDYQETISYLHVVPTIGAMLSINPITLEEGDIYYVANLNDYSEYDEKPPCVEGEMIVSHYFVLKSKHETSKFSTWRNIVAKPTEKEGVIEMVEESVFKQFFEGEWDYSGSESAYQFCFKHMVYLENIFSTNVGNNPHVGFGNYDDGLKFLQYMKTPFKYSIDESKIQNLSYKNLARMITFDDIYDEEGKYQNKTNDKIQIMGEMSNMSEIEPPTQNENGEWEWKYEANTDKINKDDENGNDIFKRWYINTKVLTITNNMGEENALFSHYFKNIIMPYLMQVIPSTTILKLKGF